MQQVKVAGLNPIESADFYYLRHYYFYKMTEKNLNKPNNPPSQNATGGQARE